jgi:hypothetical protein
VGSTRVTLDTVVTAFKLGATAEEIAQKFPVLSLADIYAVIAYYLRERDAVEAYLAERVAARRAVQRENEARHDPVGIRERLLARKKSDE